MLENLRAFTKLVLSGFVIITLLFFSSIFLYPFYKIRPYKFRPILSKYIQFIIKVVSRILALNIVLKNEELVSQKENYLFVCNHLTYLDILVISNFLNLSYITSYEMKEDKVLGKIVELAGCVFVERRLEKRNVENRAQEHSDIKKSLENGINIGLFPEATSTNGENVISFKKGMYWPAYEMKKKILVGCLNYRKINGKAISQNNRDKIFWYNEMKFFPHLWDVLKLKKIDVELELIEFIDSSKFSDIKSLVDHTRRLVVERYTPLV